MICFLFRMSLMRPTHSLHCVLLREQQAQRWTACQTGGASTTFANKHRKRVQTHHLLLLKR